MLKKITVFLLFIAITLTLIPEQAFAGINTDTVLEPDMKSYLLNLVGTEDAPTYHSGTVLSKNMSALQVASGLEELLDFKIAAPLQELEDAVAFSQNNGSDIVFIGDATENYDDVVELLTQLRKVWTEAKGCLEIISEDRAFILSAIEDLETGDAYSPEHERESLAYQIRIRADELEKQIAAASKMYEDWMATINNAKYHLSSDDSFSDTDKGDLQSQLGLLKKDRVAKMKQIAALEPNDTSKDIVIDVISIYEIRITPMDENGNPLKDAVVYCWPVNESNPERNKGKARHPNSEGYVSISTVEMGADEDHYITVGYEIVCSGYRTQYAEANFIKGGEDIRCYLQKNDPTEDVYVAGISLNGFDCKWYAKELYITEENDADQTVELFLRSQSGKEFSGTAQMKYLEKESDKYITLASDYSSSKGSGSAVFASKLCQNVAGGQENAMTFTLSSSTSNAEISPMLKSETALTSKTQLAKDDDLLKALYMGRLSLSWPGDVPFLDNMRIDLDVSQIFNGHIYILTNCSGLYAIFGSTNQQPGLKSIETLNDGWKTADSKKIDAYSKKTTAAFQGVAKQEIESNYKDLKYATKTTGTFGGRKIYGSGTVIITGSYDDPEGKANSAMLGAQIGFRGDWNRQFFIMSCPMTLNWGFDLSAAVFFKFPYDGQEFSGADISAAFRLSGYISIGPGWRFTLFGKTITAGFGLRAQLVLLLDLPLFTNVGSSSDKIFTINVTASFYADFFFAHYICNLYSGIGTWNISTGDWHWENKPIWKGAYSPDALSEATGISLGDADNSDGTKPEEEIFSQDEINGDTNWSYSSYEFTKNAESIPTYFTLHWYGSDEYHSDSDYIFWVEDGSSVKYTSTNKYDEYERSFVFPDEIQEHLTSGDWKVTGVRAATHPEVYNVNVAYYSHYEVQKVQLATVSVTIGTDWISQTDVIDGQTVTKEVPTGSVVVTRVYLYNDYNMSNLQYVDSSEQHHDIIFVDKTNYPVSEALGMVYNISLKAWHPTTHATFVDEIILDPDPPRPADRNDLDSSDENSEVFDSNGAFLITFATSDDPELLGMTYFTSSSLNGWMNDATLRKGSLPKSTPVKQLVGGAANYGFIIALMDDGSIYNFSAYRAKSTPISSWCSLDEMSDIAIIRTDYEENGPAYYTLFCAPKSSDTLKNGKRDSLQSVVLEVNDSSCYPLEVTDYDVDLNGAPIYAGHLLNEDYLYWFENFEDETTKEAHIAVKGMCYSPEYNMMTSPYRLGVLEGSDGTIPEGYLVTGIPVFSQVMSDGNMIITKPWLADTDEKQSETNQVFSSYKVAVVRRVYAELMGAGTEMPAVSAGRDCNMLFTLLNKGNMPILGFDMNIYHNNAKGQRELVQSSHIDVTNQSKNKVTFLKSGYSESQPVVFGGEYSARRIGGLFDRINKDEWYITRSSLSDSIFVNVPALMTEGIQTYTMVFAVPADWANKTEIACEIEQIYVPKKVSDIFALSDTVGETTEALSEMQVFAVSSNKTDENMDLAGNENMARVVAAGSLNEFYKPDENALSVSEDMLTDEHGERMTYTFMPSLRDVEFDTINLSLKCRAFEKNEKEYVTITVYQDGQTDHVAPRGVTINAHVDDDKYPSFTHTFNTHHEDGQCAYNITLPVSELSGGRNADRLIIRVSDTVEGNEEMADVDDTCIIDLNNNLRIKQHPGNTTAQAGENAEFSVKAIGGTEPYDYCWQKLNDGKWINIKAVKGSVLTLKKTTTDMDGMAIRCVITDSNGDCVTSDYAILTVNENPYVPDTGDSNNRALWLIVFLTLAFGIGFALILQRKGDR